MSDEIDQLPEIPAAASPIAPGTLDRAGTAYDPARHIPRSHPKTGRWMPRGGRKPAAALNTAPAPTTSAPAQPVTPAPVAAPAPAMGPDSAAPSLADIERAANAPAPAEAAQADEKAADARAVMVDGAEAQASTIWKAVYAVTGVVTGAPEESTRAGAAHANLCSALSAWMVESNIKIKGVWGLIIAVVCYFAETGTKPKTRAWFDRMTEKWGKKKTPIQSVSIGETQPARPAPVAAPVAPSEFVGIVT